MLEQRSAVSFGDLGPVDGPAEAVFDAFDGRLCQIDGRVCHVEVFGVFEADGQRWVQLALDGDQQRMLTLRLRAASEPAGALVSQGIATIAGAA